MRTKTKGELLMIFVSFLIVTSLIIFVTVFWVSTNRPTRKPIMDDHGRIIKDLNSFASQKEQVYDRNLIGEVKNFDDNQNLGIRFEYPITWSLNKNVETYPSEIYNYISLRRDNYIIDVIVTSNKWDSSSDSGTISFADVINEYFILNTDIDTYYLIPKLKEPFDNPPYNTQHILFLNGPDLEYTDIRDESDGLIYTGLIYNGKGTITVNLNSPQGVTDLDQNVINEIYFILANLDFGI